MAKQKNLAIQKAAVTQPWDECTCSYMQTKLRKS